MNAKQLNLKSTDFRTNSIPHLLPIGSLSLETSVTASCGRYDRMRQLFDIFLYSYSSLNYIVLKGTVKHPNLSRFERVNREMVRVNMSFASLYRRSNSWQPLCVLSPMFPSFRPPPAPPLGSHLIIQLRHETMLGKVPSPLWSFAGVWGTFFSRKDNDQCIHDR